MALTLKMSTKYLYDGSEIYVYDSTLTYGSVAEADGGWGVTTSEGTNPDRSDRTLVFFAKFIDHESTETYLELKDQYPGTFTNLGLAPGGTLGTPPDVNSIQSMFTVLSGTDGHHQFYMLPVAEAADSTGQPAVDGNLYYDTTQQNLYIYSGTQAAWIPVDSTSYFATFEAKTETKMCEYLVITGLLTKKQELTRTWWDCYLSRECKQEDMFYNLQYLRSRMEGAQADFYGGLQPTARKTLQQLARKFCNADTC